MSGTFVDEFLPIPVVDPAGSIVSLQSILEREFGPNLGGFTGFYLAYYGAAFLQNPFVGNSDCSSYWDPTNPSVTSWFINGSDIGASTAAHFNQVFVPISQIGSVTLHVGDDIASYAYLTVPDSTVSSSPYKVNIQFDITTVAPNLESPTAASGAPNPGDIVAAAERYAATYNKPPVPPNDGDCWNIAEDVASAAGTPLPIPSGNDDPHTNVEGGFWRIVYRGSNPNPVANWQTLVQPGDMVRMVWASGGDHTTTVLAVNSDGSITVFDNSYFDRSTGHYTIGIHTANYDTATVASSITIYRLSPDHLYLINGIQDEVLNGSPYNNEFNAVSGDIVNCGPGNDIVNILSGNISVNGGAGQDTVALSASFATYQITDSSGRALSVSNGFVLDPTGGAIILSTSGASDTLNGVSKLQFADRTLSVIDSASVPPINIFVAQQNMARQAIGLPNNYVETAGVSASGGNSVIGFQNATLPSGASNTVILNNPRASYAVQIDGAANLLVKDIGVGDATLGQTISVAGDTYLLFNGGSDATPGLYDQAMFIESGSDATITRLYEAVLGREPDLPGLEQWVGAYNSGGLTLAQIEQGFVGSQEFASRFPGATDAQFVTALYENTLGRGPDHAGLAGWVSLLGHDEQVISLTAARAIVVDGFMTSQEFINDTVSWLVDPTTGGYADPGVLLPAQTAFTQAVAHNYLNTALIDPTTLGSGISNADYQASAGGAITVLPGAPAQTVVLSANFTNLTIENAGSSVYAGSGGDTINIAGGANTSVALGSGNAIDLLGGANTLVYSYAPGQHSALNVANTTTAAEVDIHNGSSTPVNGASLNFSATSAIVINVGSIGNGAAASAAAAANNAYVVADKPFEHVTFMGLDSNGNTEFWFFGSTAGVQNGIIPGSSLTNTADTNSNHQVDPNEIIHLATVLGVAPGSFAATDLA
jgi:Domain of unknown function (DUF4214)